MKACIATAAGAKELREIAGADTSPLATICNSFALNVVETVEAVARQDVDVSPEVLDFVLNTVLRSNQDLTLAVAALTVTRGLEARLRVAEAQLARSLCTAAALEARLRVVEAQLGCRPDPDADLH